MVALNNDDHASIAKLCYMNRTRRRSRTVCSFCRNAPKGINMLELPSTRTVKTGLRQESEMMQ